jgi:hypothetical protein
MTGGRVLLPKIETPRRMFHFLFFYIFCFVSFYSSPPIAFDGQTKRYFSYALCITIRIAKKSGESRRRKKIQMFAIKASEIDNQASNTQHQASCSLSCIMHHATCT